MSKLIDACRAFTRSHSAASTIRIAIKDGQELTRYEPTGNMGEGRVFAPEQPIG
ncbi:hypothetical protein [Azospirillum palustre]|uniref:hypothetical protein n=1 Tax=Azospirillum palustre TaxID=2044885 RepID=UPI001956CA9B|nr:hypothetical protein [Azospirillum palustre]